MKNHMKNQIDQLLKRAQSERAKLSRLEAQILRQKTAVQNTQNELARALSGKPQGEPAEAAPSQS
jgi:hypothetical protein